MVKLSKVLLSFPPSKGGVAGAGEEEEEEMMKNLVVLSGASSMFSASTVRPWTSAAILEAMAAAAGSGFASCAALEVDETSIRSTAFRCAVRNSSHWPKACGCE